MQGETSKIGDDDYDTSLQRLMNRCLPPILVDIVEKRPPDPIQYMAQCLYRFREKEDEDLDLHSSNQLQSKDEQNTISLDNNKPRTYSNTSGLVKEVKGTRKLPNNRFNIVEGAEDFYELTDDFESISLSQTILHESTKPIFQTVGDLFDDDDFS